LHSRKLPVIIPDVRDSPTSEKVPARTVETLLSAREKDALLHLGDEGAGGNFDQIAMCKLVAMGMVEVRSQDRRLILTEAGREAYLLLKAAIQPRRPK